jgi:hypothetical protein
MSEAVKPRTRVIAVLKLPEYEVPRLVTQARAILEAMTKSSWFPKPRPPLARIEKAIEELATAQTATHTRAAGTVAVRDDKRRALVALLQELLTYVQAVADANVENAPSIIESALVSVKKARVLPPRTFAVKPGRVSGTVKLIAPKAANRAGYEWGRSTDGGRTWETQPFTVNASITVTGLRPGSTVHFRYRSVTNKGRGDWSDPVAVIVD